MLEEARRRIAAVLDQPGMNKVALAHQAGVHRNTLHGIEHASWNPSSHTLDAILSAVARLEKTPEPKA